MFQTIRLTAWHDGALTGPSRLVALQELKETLLMLTDRDQMQVDFICSSVEETGACRLIDEEDDNVFILEKVLHS
jgi:hypothetical protein